jgi:hypothetical protein
MTKQKRFSQHQKKNKPKITSPEDSDKEIRNKVMLIINIVITISAFAVTYFIMKNFPKWMEIIERRFSDMGNN